MQPTLNTSPTRLWISHWFGTAYHLIQFIRYNADGRPFHIIGSNEKPHSVTLTACDMQFIEPPLQGEAYVEYALDMCRREQVELFVPSYKKLLAIAEHIAEFDALGVRVLVGRDAASLAMLHHKPSAYASAQAQHFMPVPEYRVVTTPEEFRLAYQELKDLGHEVCIKPVAAQGGEGFRILDERYEQFKALFHPPSARMSFAQLCRLLDTQTQFSALLVSEYLEGLEYSIDCLSDSEGRLLAAVPRRKLDERQRYLEDNQKLLEIAQRAADIYRLPYGFNVQLRYRGQIPKLLEINPRWSGGLYLSCLSGVNFPYLSLKLLNGERIELLQPRLDQVVREIEAPLGLIEAGWNVQR